MDFNMKRSFICDILQSKAMRVFFIIQAMVVLVECVQIIAASFMTGSIAIGMLSFLLSAALIVISVRMTIICAKGGRHTPHEFARFINYYGILLMWQLISVGRIKSALFLNFVLCTAYVFMLIAFWKPDAMKKVSFTGVLILFYIAALGAGAIFGYETYRFLQENIEPAFAEHNLPGIYLDVLTILSVAFALFWYAVKFILPTAIFVWIGKHKNDEDNSIEIII